jgi:ubiquitin-like-conjugating enzyme ATG3
MEVGYLLSFKIFSWESGKPDLRSKYLPPEKQFLITKGVPCSKRIKTLQAQESKEREVEDGWVETDNPSQVAGAGKQVTMDIDDIGQVVDIDDEQQEEQEVMDIDDI